MRGVLLLLCAATMLGACGMQQAAANTASNGSIRVEQAWVRPAVMMEGMNLDAMGEATAGTHDATQHGATGDMGSTSAAYMTIVNSGSTADALVRVSSDVAQVVELHTVEMDNNVARMRPVQEIPLPADGQVELKQGGYHVMLIGIKQNLAVGSTVNLTLTFQSGNEVTLAAPVRERAP
jgi:periplasmic copper chaperone A